MDRKIGDFKIDQNEHVSESALNYRLCVEVMYMVRFCTPSTFPGGAHILRCIMV